MSDIRSDDEHPQTVIGVRELRNQVAAMVRRAGSGERLLVTVDGHPAAQLGPIQPDRTGVTLWDLAAAGLIEPPRRPSSGPGARTEQPPAPVPLPADLNADRLLESSRGR